MKGRSSTPRGLDSRYSGFCDGAATPGDTRPRSPSLVRCMKQSETAQPRPLKYCTTRHGHGPRTCLD